MGLMGRSWAILTDGRILQTNYLFPACRYVSLGLGLERTCNGAVKKHEMRVHHERRDRRIILRTMTFRRNRCVDLWAQRVKRELAGGWVLSGLRMDHQQPSRPHVRWLEASFLSHLEKTLLKILEFRVRLESFASLMSLQ